MVDVILTGKFPGTSPTLGSLLPETTTFLARELSFHVGGGVSTTGIVFMSISSPSFGYSLIGMRLIPISLVLCVFPGV